MAVLRRGSVVRENGGIEGMGPIGAAVAGVGLLGARDDDARAGHCPYCRRSASESGSRAARIAACAPAMS